MTGAAVAAPQAAVSPGGGQCRVRDCGGEVPSGAQGLPGGRRGGASPVVPASSSWRRSAGRAGPSRAQGSSSVMSRMLPSSAVKVGRSSAFCRERVRSSAGACRPPHRSPQPGGAAEPRQPPQGTWGWSPRVRATYLVPAAVHDGVDPLRGLLRPVEAQALDDVLCCLAVIKPLIRHLSQRVNFPHQNAC